MPEITSKIAALPADDLSRASALSQVDRLGLRRQK
jgi:hypothetical protein